jgi:hypothetical protein
VISSIAFWLASVRVFGCQTGSQTDPARVCSHFDSFQAYCTVFVIISRLSAMKSLRRFSDMSKLHSYLAKAPSKAEPAWTRLANKLKNQEVPPHLADSVKNKVASVEDHVSHLEEELREEMAKALGKTGRTCVYLFSLLKAADAECDSADLTLEQRKEAIETYNEIRRSAEQARYELVIHRQAIGLTWRNQAIVEAEFPLLPPRRLPRP